MKELKIETGKKEYNLGGKVTVEFSPTDMDFVERVINVLQKAEEKQKETESELKGADTSTIFEIAKRRDKEMRELVDELFGVEVCTPLFGTMNTFARDNGLPLWANVLTAVLDECYDNLSLEDKATGERIKKYTKKYQKR